MAQEQKMQYIQLGASGVKVSRLFYEELYL